jgi:hypothetical protein
VRAAPGAGKVEQRGHADRDATGATTRVRFDRRRDPA